jgi:hypothetical protein
MEVTSFRAPPPVPPIPSMEHRGRLAVLRDDGRAVPVGRTSTHSWPRRFVVSRACSWRPEQIRDHPRQAAP